MHVKHLVLGSTESDGRVVGSPGIEDIVLALRSLDGHVCTELSLQGVDDDHYFQIGGGPDDFVIGCRIGETLYIAYDPTIEGDATRWVVAGQSVGYPLNECLLIDKAEQVVRTYAASGEIDPVVAWHKI
jgi:hypothetical protein